MTVLETVTAHYTFPPHIKQVHPRQVEVINDLAPLNGSGEWLDMGTGKTLCATVCSLYHILAFGHVVVVIMPPLLIGQWARWLRGFKPAITVTEYRGTPAQRAKLSLDVQFVLVGIQIFKRDYKRFEAHYAGRPKTVIVDEATIVGNVESDQHHKVYDFAVGSAVSLLTGTPMNKPLDAYGLIKFTAPGTYRNKNQFENLHIADRDFFGQPTEYMNLDMLKDNLGLNSKRLLYSDMYKDIEEPLFVPLNYDLDPGHMKLYRRLAEEELLKLPDGGKIDATTATRLRHALGQIACNYGHFSGNPADVSDAVEMVKQKLDELGREKLVVFADYKMTVRTLKEHLSAYGVVTINSEVTERAKEMNLARFKEDPSCRVIVIQFISGGKGLDGLQHVCNHCLFIEPCQQPRDFHQAVARLKRTGQMLRVWVGLAIANGTTQVRGFENLLDNDTLVNKVVRNVADLRSVIFGG